MTHAIDLTGRWHGIFNYPDGHPPNGFEADLREAGGVLTGETWEPSDGIDDIAPEQRALIEGRRTGAAVRFVKRYNELHRLPVAYDGTVDADAAEIAGRWTISGDWSGSFIMVRPARDAVAAETTETVPADHGP